MNNKKVFVAMSGGVDSSVCAALLKEQGHDVSGVTMCLEIPPAPGKNRPSCCGLESIEDARRVCRALGIQHHVLNYGDIFHQEVIEDFIREYTLGRTPNPCVRCNQYLKFDRLFHDAKALGATHLATGHYARIDPMGDHFALKKGVDPNKDQSYFLYGIPKALLPFILFPLGSMTKTEVREHARRFALPVAEKRESQDICFIPSGKYQDFIAERVPEGSKPGVFVDHTGKIVGKHSGVLHFTVGQREGLGIALGYPAYINRIELETNTIHVGPKEYLYSHGLEAKGLNLVSMNFSQETFEAGLKIRYNHHDIKGTVQCIDTSCVRVMFDVPEQAVTPGQSVVFYDGDVLLGGGVIERKIE
jgi:tRNA-uridine 2-sulfurtransferase